MTTGGQFYGTEEAVKYRKSSRMIAVQGQMSRRALELLMLEEERRRRTAGRFLR